MKVVEDNSAEVKKSRNVNLDSSDQVAGNNNVKQQALEAAGVAVSQSHNMAIQTESGLEEDYYFNEDAESLDSYRHHRYYHRNQHHDAGFSSDGELLIEQKNINKDASHRKLSKQKSISLNDILSNSFVHESVTGERIIISRGWPTINTTNDSSRRHYSSRRKNKHGSKPRRHNYDNNNNNDVRPRVLNKVKTNKHRLSLNEEQKRHLLMEFLQRNPSSNKKNQIHLISRAGSPILDKEQEVNLIATQKLSNDFELEFGSNNHHRLSNREKLVSTPISARHLPQEILGASKGAQNKGAPVDSNSILAGYVKQSDYTIQSSKLHSNNLEDRKRFANKRLENDNKRPRELASGKKAMIVQYDLAPYPPSAGPIALE